MRWIARNVLLAMLLPGCIRVSTRGDADEAQARARETRDAQRRLDEDIAKSQRAKEEYDRQEAERRVSEEKATAEWQAKRIADLDSRIAAATEACTTEKAAAAKEQERRDDEMRAEEVAREAEEAKENANRPTEAEVNRWCTFTDERYVDKVPIAQSRYEGTLYVDSAPYTVTVPHCRAGTPERVRAEAQRITEPETTPGLGSGSGPVARLPTSTATPGMGSGSGPVARLPTFATTSGCTLLAGLKRQRAEVVDR